MSRCHSSTASLCLSSAPPSLSPFCFPEHIVQTRDGVRAQHVVLQDASPSDVVPQIYYRHRRDKNNMASRKSREKRRLRDQQLEQVRGRVWRSRSSQGC